MIKKLIDFLLYFLSFIFIITGFSILFSNDYIYGVSIIMVGFLFAPKIYYLLKNFFTNKFKINKFKSKYIFFTIFIFILGALFSDTEKLQENKESNIYIVSNESVTSESNFNLRLKQENINSITVNGNNVEFNKNDEIVNYSLEIQDGVNNFEIIGKNGSYEQTINKEIKKLTEEELEKEKNKKIEEELQAQLTYVNSRLEQREIDNFTEVYQAEKIQSDINKYRNVANKYINNEKYSDLANELKSKADRVEEIYIPLKEKIINKANSKWNYDSSTDQMSGEITEYAIIKSENIEYFEFPYNGGSDFTLTLRDKSGSLDILFSVSQGQFLGSYSGRNIRIKFDENEPYYINFNEPSDGSSDVIFLGSEYNLLNKIKNHDKLLIEAEFYNEGRRIAEFDISGFDWD